MAFNGKYEYNHEGIDQIISEKGDYFLALREVRWSSNKEFKNDLRRYRSDEEGDIALKGCAFNDDEADELVKVLIEEGFGDNDDLIDIITAYRPDICKELNKILSEDTEMSNIDSRIRLFQRRQKEDENDESFDDYYDPKRDLFEENA